MIPVSIIIADDHSVVRSGIKNIFGSDPGFQIVHEAGDGASAIQLMRTSKPDVAIIDIEMPEMNGFEIAEAVKNEDLQVRLIFMSMYSDEYTFNRAMDLGIHGFVLKDNAVNSVKDAVRSVMDGKYYICPVFSDYVLKRNPLRQYSSKLPAQSIKSLTPSEKVILGMIAEKKTTNTIAEELFISPKTVDKHRSNICAKLELHGAYALLKFALDTKNQI
jgi:DNA-binding NarL/FixJ family response regulator